MENHTEKISILKSILGSPIAKGKEYLFFCPTCKHHKPKLSINIQKDVFKCWVCGYSATSIYRLVRKFGSFLEKSRWGDLDQQVDINISLYEKLFPGKKKEEEPVVQIPEEFCSLANNNLPATAIMAKKYLKARGVTRRDILKWKIGFCYDGEYGGRVIIPSFGAGGKPNYFIARSYEQHWDRYKNPPVSRNIIFNDLYVDWKNDLCLVEGVFDAIVAENAVPLLGSVLSEKSRLFKEILNHDTPVYLALDADAEKKSVRLISSLLKYGLEVYKVDIHPYNDVGDMSKEEFLSRKKNARVMSSDYLVHYQLENL